MEQRVRIIKLSLSVCPFKQLIETMLQKYCTPLLYILHLKKETSKENHFFINCIFESGSAFKRKT